MTYIVKILMFFIFSQLIDFKETASGSGGRLGIVSFPTTVKIISNHESGDKEIKLFYTI